MYRPVRIEVTPCLFGYEAHIIQQDDGIDEDGEPQWCYGFDLQWGPFYGLTHKRAWKRAYRACGRRLYTELTEEDRQLLLKGSKSG